MSSSLLINYESCKVSKVLPVTWDHGMSLLFKKLAPRQMSSKESVFGLNPIY